MTDTPCAAFATSTTCGCLLHVLATVAAQRADECRDAPGTSARRRVYSLFTHRMPRSPRASSGKKWMASQFAPNWRCCRSAAPGSSNTPSASRDVSRSATDDHRLSPQRTQQVVAVAGRQQHGVGLAALNRLEGQRTRRSARSCTHRAGRHPRRRAARAWRLSRALAGASVVEKEDVRKASRRVVLFMGRAGRREPAQPSVFRVAALLQGNQNRCARAATRSAPGSSRAR